MGRKLKFRVWDGSNMWYPDTKDADGTHTTLSFFNNPKCIDWGLYSGMDYRVASGEYDHIMQFTGLYDIEGKEIYEEDILIDHMGMVEMVSWRDGQFYFVTSGHSFNSGMIKGNKIKVIGNLWENKNLLKTKK